MNTDNRTPGRSNKNTSDKPQPKPLHKEPVTQGGGKPTPNPKGYGYS